VQCREFPEWHPRIRAAADSPPRSQRRHSFRQGTCVDSCEGYSFQL